MSKLHTLIPLYFLFFVIILHELCGQIKNVQLKAIAAFSSHYLISLKYYQNSRKNLGLNKCCEIDLC